MLKKINKSIIIPFYDCFELVMQRLAELTAMGLPDDYEVILVNDGSIESKTDLLLLAARKQFPIFRTIGYEVNHGFASANNLGASDAQGNVLCFLSSDVVIRKPFWGQLNDLDNIVLGGRYINIDAGWNAFAVNGGPKVIFPYLEGWFIACARDAFEDIGRWDAQYDPFDYEDLDFSTAARELEYQLEYMSPLFFQHQLGGTIFRKTSAEGRMKITRRNQELFIQKWIESKRYEAIK